MIYIKILKNLNLNNTVVSLGNFDGFHIGHQKLINTAIKEAKNHSLKSVIFSFYPHPRQVLYNEIVPLILTPNEKNYLLEKTEIDYYVEYPFTKDFSKLNPCDFFEKVLVDGLGCKKIVIGEGYRFGKKQEGNQTLLKQLCDLNNIELIVLKHINAKEQEKVSSSKIRELILDNQFLIAEKYLSRPYFIKGEVVSGKQIGHKICFPTANLIPDKNKLVPSNGIFITDVLYKKNIYKSVTNIGTNPTVNGQTKTIETYIFDFEQNIYHEDILVNFYKKIRDEIKFDSLEQLKTQIAKDVLKAKEFFANN